MVRLIRNSVVPLLLVAGCYTAPPRHDTFTAEQHEMMAASFEATANSIEDECWKARRHELTVTDPNPCWKAEDIRFLEANRNAAAQQRALARTKAAQEAQAAYNAQTAPTAQTARR